MHSIRTLGKSTAALLYRAAQLLGLAAVSVIEDDIPAPINAGVIPPPTAEGVYVSRVHRSRVPHSNREARRRHGIPHGTSGAKLARKALKGAL